MRVGIFGIGLAAYWPQFEGLRERLETGIAWADVGCGAGHAVIRRAQECPRSTFACFDVTHRVLIGWRPGGNASIVLTSKSAKYDSASVRGIGVAVITR